MSAVTLPGLISVISTEETFEERIVRDELSGFLSPITTLSELLEGGVGSKIVGKKVAILIMIKTEVTTIVTILVRQIFLNSMITNDIENKRTLFCLLLVELLPLASLLTLLLKE